MKPPVAPDWEWLRMDDRRGRWVQVFARLKRGHTVASAQPPLQGLFTQIRTYESTLPAAKDWSAYREHTGQDARSRREEPKFQPDGWKLDPEQAKVEGLNVPCGPTRPLRPGESSK